MKNNWYEIKDLTGFIEHSREITFRIFAQEDNLDKDQLSEILSYALTDAEEEELKNLLTFSECDVIIKQCLKRKTNKKTLEDHYYVTDKILLHIMEELNSRMVSNILHKLVKDGILDTAFDSNQNDFIFWIKDLDKNANKKNQMPETD